jgi:hypothetical protein
MCENAPVMPLRNLSILLVCQLISATGAIVLITLGGIIGSSLTQNQALATLPVSIMVICVAATTVPATLLMRSIGRKHGSTVASLSAAVASLIAAYAISVSSFPQFIAAAAVFGINMAFTQQYRYAAAESVDTKYVPRAISFVLLGSIGGAFVGPILVTRGQYWVADVPYAGTMLAVAGLYAVQAIVFLFLRKTHVDKETEPAMPGRPLSDVVKQPVFMVAVLGGTAGYGLMTLVMTATPLSMHINDGMSLAVTAGVIQAHVLAM